MIRFLKKQFMIKQKNDSIIYRRIMDIEPKSLYAKGKSSTMGKIVGKWKVKKHGTVIQVEIHEHGLNEKNSEGSSNSILFDFDLKFGFNKEALEIKFQRGAETVDYKFLQMGDLEQWRNLLKNKINQRGFHEQFKPLKKIGKGNFASVYLAQKLEDGVFYAVKAFSKEAAYGEENGKECLIKEIDVMRCLNHPNTMKLHEVFESQNSLYIIFELLSGGQLQDKVKNKHTFKPKEIRDVMYGILKGLREMHSKGIMHRDLKPENLLLRNDGDWDCVIADFGLAEFANIQTYLFVRCGTPGYVAPEVINIKDMSTKYDPICDLYSLGLIFHMLLFGKSAFPGKTYNEVLKQNREAKINLDGDYYLRFYKNEPQAYDLLCQLLKSSPSQRITAERALGHPYFTTPGENSMVDEKFEKVPFEGRGHYSEVNSPLLTTANEKRKEDRTLKKDSCATFHMGRENLMTGKTEEVESLRSNKISISNANTPLKKPKMSQFNAQKR